VASFDAVGSSSFHSPGRSVRMGVFQSKDLTSCGSGTVFRPCAKSSMSRPTAAAVNAFEVLPIVMSV
jgi:hypothetical protein